jgi:hypothetical protein
MKTNPIQSARKRKMLLVLPALVIPFVTLLFWSFGGGSAAGKTDTVPLGINTRLPDASLSKDSTLNKMSYYDRALADSSKIREQMRADPYSRTKADSIRSLLPLNNGGIAADEQLSMVGNDSPAGNAAQISQKIARLQRVMNEPEARPAVAAERRATPEAADEKKKEAGTIATPDPEMQQMNGLLEKILDIQHPERVSTREEGPVEKQPERFAAVPAVIDGDQKIVQGSVIRLKLLDSVTLNGQFIPKGHLLFGSGELFNQRVKLRIRLVRLGYQVIPVDLSIYDMTDGMEGINVPEAITDETMRDGAASGIQSVQLMSMDPSMNAQLANAGVNAAKGLFSKKVKRVKGKLQGGHLILIRDNKRTVVDQ